jgi:uncharacterized membrane protein YbaN (DUF454 family)
VFSPAKVIFAGIGVLLSVSIGFSCVLLVDHPDTRFFFQAANDVSASRAKLVELFSRVQYFFKRVETYTMVPPTSAMTDIIVEIFVAVLSFLALATKEATVKRGRIGKSAQR